MVIKEVKCTNGEKGKFEVIRCYFKLTLGNKTWYWNRDTGGFDGTSFKVAED